MEGNTLDLPQPISRHLRSITKAVNNTREAIQRKGRELIEAEEQAKKDEEEKRKREEEQRREEEEAEQAAAEKRKTEEAEKRAAAARAKAEADAKTELQTLRSNQAVQYPR